MEISNNADRLGFAKSILKNKQIPYWPASIVWAKLIDHIGTKVKVYIYKNTN